jgi:hypothetical protein
MKTLSTLFLLSLFSFLGTDAQNWYISHKYAGTKTGLVQIPVSNFQQGQGPIDFSQFKLIDKASNKELPYQLVLDKEKKPKDILVFTSLKAGQKLQLLSQKSKPSPLKPLTFARYVPERLDDFTWENDRIAFRTYGKALEGTKGDAYGLDVWAKRTTDLVIDRRYKHGDYHHDLGDGLDYYHVGKTLGAGNAAPYLDGKIHYSANYHSYQVIENGPLRSSFALGYDAWTVGTKTLTAVKTISLDAGSQLNLIDIKYSYGGTDSLDVAVGIIKREEAGTVLFDEKQGIMAYWEPTHGADGTTGVGVILEHRIKEIKIQDSQFLAIVRLAPGQHLRYYQGAAWDKAGQITSSADWFSYLYTFKNNIKNPWLLSPILSSKN